jgi:hypothetical protein
MSPELVLLSGAWCRGRELTRPRMRNLLALLADDPRAGCGTARLVDELWPDERPANPPKALQVLVSHTRALPRSFGHPGSGGSVGFADPDARVGFGYATNLWSFRPDDPRATNLAVAVRSCVG